MKGFARVAVSLFVVSAALSACALIEDPPPDEPPGPPGSCMTDDDCLSGNECENAWCMDDGTCRYGTPTGMSCGNNGMCVDSNCIEL